MIDALRPGPAQPDDEGVFLAHVATEGWVPGDPQPIKPGGVQWPAGKAVALSGTSHNVLVDGALQVGVAQLQRVGNEIHALGQFWLELPPAQAAWAVLRRLGSKATWSLGYRTLERTQPTTEERARGVKEWLTRVEALEISPTPTPANPGTGTLLLKSRAEAERVFTELPQRYARQQERLNREITEIFGQMRRQLRRTG